MILKLWKKLMVRIIGDPDVEEYGELGPFIQPPKNIPNEQIGDPLSDAFSDNFDMAAFARQSEAVNITPPNFSQPVSNVKQYSDDTSESLMNALTQFLKVDPDTVDGILEREKLLDQIEKDVKKLRLNINTTKAKFLKLLSTTLKTKRVKSEN